MHPSDLLPAETGPTRAAFEVASRFSSRSLVNHCSRSYLWAAAHGSASDVAFDRELLYVAAMLHDLGLTRAFDNHSEPFEHAGGHVGWVFAAGAAWPEARRERVDQIIVRHMWDQVDPAEDPEGHLLCVATGFDISGSGASAWPRAFQEQVVALHPRLDLPREFLACFEDQARRKPACAAAASVESGIADRIAANPLDRLEQP